MKNKAAMFHRGPSNDGLGGLRMGQQAIDRFAVVFTSCFCHFGFLRICNGKNISKITGNIICILVVCNSFIEASASPNGNVGPEFSDGSQVLLVKAESDLRNGTIGVFSEIEKDAIKSTAEFRTAS